MLRERLWIKAVLAVVLLHGCATGTQVRVDHDPKEDFQSLRSYAWAPATEEERVEKARDSLTHERIQAAVDAHLATRGYAKVSETQADFLVTYTITLDRRTRASDSYMSVGYGRYGGHGGVGVGYGFPVSTTVEEYKVGTLIIDIIDAKQRRLVWRGSGERTLQEGQTSERRIEMINTAVNDILGRFPPGAGKE